MKNPLGMKLIALGLFGLAWGGFAYTSAEAAVDSGPILTAINQEIQVLPPLIGAVTLLGGVALLVRGRAK